MATTTTNLGLIKPALSDLYDVINVTNANSDTIDSAVHNVVVGTDGKRYQIIACVLRNTAGTWAILDDTGHTPVGVTSVSADATAITLTYNFTSAKIGSLVCCPDETYAADGIIFGASVGDTTATIKASISKTIGGYIFYNGSAWDFSLAPGVTAVEWIAGNTLKVSHSTIYQPVNYNCSVVGRAGITNPVLSTTTGAISEDYILIDFYDWDGTKITTPNTNMKLIFTRTASGLVNPLLLTQTASNIWVYGIFEIA